jgi:hypothetical protein
MTLTEEHPHQCSGCDPANKNQIKKSQYMLVLLRKMVFLCRFARFAEAAK